jgi:hypothetical protein
MKSDGKDLSTSACIGIMRKSVQCPFGFVVSRRNPCPIPADNQRRCIPHDERAEIRQRSEQCFLSCGFLFSFASHTTSPSKCCLFVRSTFHAAGSGRLTGKQRAAIVTANVQVENKHNTA